MEGNEVDHYLEGWEGIFTSESSLISHVHSLLNSDRLYYLSPLG